MYHIDVDRAFVGTWVTDEVKEAVQQGYLVQNIYEVLYFESISQYNSMTKAGGIFTEYMNTFLKVKQEASGWPDWWQTFFRKASIHATISTGGHPFRLEQH